MNGRTVSIPGDVMMSPSSKSPKSPSSQANIVEKRNSMRQQEVGGAREKEHREHVNGAKVGNHYNNNSKVNSVCLNNLILPLLSEVSHATFLVALSLLSADFLSLWWFIIIAVVEYFHARNKTAYKTLFFSFILITRKT